jgi:hypothetical protein
MIKGIEINRLALVDAIIEEIMAGFLLVLGEPGIGKSHTLNAIAQILIKRKYEVFFIEADRYELKSMQDFNAELKLPGDFYEALLDLESDKKAFLIIDGLDAARDENSQNVFRELIRSVKLKAANWTIIAGVRTFDALRSKEIRSLFSDVTPTNQKYKRKDIVQNHILIPLLTDDELEQAFIQEEINIKKSTLRQLYLKSSVEFKQILRTPRNIEFSMSLIQDGINVLSLSAIQAEVQLLNLIWEHYVLSENSEINRLVVKDVCDGMLKGKKFVVDRTQIAKNLGIDTTKSIKTLLTDSIFEEFSKQSDFIRFSNHTLYDYAIARHIIPEDSIKDQIEFIRKKENSLFFRPSIRYFYSSQWFRLRDDFWKLLIVISQEKDISPAEQAIPFVTLIEESRGIEDLDPLLNLCKSPDTYPKQAVRYSLISLGYLLRTKTLESLFWLQYLYDLTDVIDIRNWGFIVHCIDKFGEKESLKVIKSNKKYFKFFAESNRKLLIKGWELNNEWVLNVNFRNTVVNVCKSFEENVGESKKVLENILGRLEKSTIAVEEFYWLCNGVLHIANYDPEFVFRIYEKGFSHIENSEEKRNMGGAVLGLITDVKQDFHMSQYILNEAFPEFLKKYPQYGTKTVISIIKSHYKTKEMTVDDDITFEDDQIKYTIDLSCIWDQRDNNYGDYAVAILHDYEKWLKSMKDEETILEITNILLATNTHAAVWRRILIAIENNPQNLKFIAIKLLSQNSILGFRDTHDLATKALHAIFPIVDSNEKKILESSIESLSDFDLSLQYGPEYLDQSPEEISEDRQTIQGEVLSRIPRDLIQSATLLHIYDILSSKNKLNDPVPPFKLGEVESRPYTSQMWLEDKGVNLKKEPDESLFNASEKLSIKIEEIKKATLSELNAIEDEIKTLWESYSKNSKTCQEHVRVRVLTVLTEIASSVIQHEDFPIQSEYGELLENIIYHSAVDASPEYDPKYHSEFKHPSWSPSPRTEATRGLINLIVRHHKISDQIKILLLQLAEDKVPAVRFHTIWGINNVFNCNQELYWQIVNRVADSEITPGVLHEILNNLAGLVGVKGEEDKIEKTVIKFMLRSNNEELDYELIKSVFSILTQIYIRYGKEESNSLIQDELRGNIKSAPLVLTIIKNTFPYLLLTTSQIYSRWDGREIIQSRSLKLTFECLDFVEKQISKMTDEEVKENIANVREMYRIIDAVIEYFYFDVDFGTKHQRESAISLTDQERKKFFENVALPIINKMIDTTRPERGGAIPASSAHHFLEIALLLLPINFKEVIRLVYQVYIASKSAGYLNDSFSIKTLTELIDQSLADYRYILRDDPETMLMLSKILDLFVDVGWDEAVGLVLRLDNVFR